MANFLDELRKKMAASPHVGPTPVTNPKLPTKVERDVAEFKVRQKAMPNFKFGTGTVLQQIKEHTEKCPHVGPTYADPKFHGFDKNCLLSKAERDEFESKYEAYAQKLKLESEKRKKDTERNAFESKYQVYAQKLRDENSKRKQEANTSTNNQ